MPGELHGRFELTAPLGSGGLATVWRALDRKSRLPVALKVLHPHLRHDRVVAERFRREAAVLRTVSHASVVRAFEVFEDEGALSFSMELLEGRTLKERIRAEGALPAEEVTRIARETLSGLAAAHAAGVTHRDLKPQNIFLLPDGTVKLLDFGLARVSAAAGLTTRSLVLCTPDYAAPEQIEGKAVDGRADLYALGVVLYEALTGKPPFRGATPFELLQQHLTVPPPSPRSLRAEVPPELDAVAARLLQKRPEDRFSTAQAVLEALDRPGMASPKPPETVCPVCGAPREVEWPICPACGASDGTAVEGEWMVVLVRVPDPKQAAPLLREIIRSVGAEPGHDDERCGVERAQFFVAQGNHPHVRW